MPQGTLNLKYVYNFKIIIYSEKIKDLQNTMEQRAYSIDLRQGFLPVRMIW